MSALAKGRQSAKVANVVAMSILLLIFPLFMSHNVARNGRACNSGGGHEAPGKGEYCGRKRLM